MEESAKVGRKEEKELGMEHVKTQIKGGCKEERS